MAYNGWANYETWAVALWIDNDEGMYTERNRLIKHASKGRDISDANETNDITSTLADLLKDWVGDMAPELEGLWADLLSSALSEVD